MTPPEHGSTVHGIARQSTLRQFDMCGLRTMYEAKTGGDWSNEWAALGTALHLVAEQIWTRLRATGADRVSSDEALTIARVAAASPDCPHLTLDQLRELRILVLQLAVCEWPARRILAIEQRLTADVRCPDGVVRQITGKPDLLIRDGSDGVIYVDLKTSYAVPSSTPRDGDFSKDNGRAYVSDRGTFQLDVGGYLIMRTYPAVNRTLLREYYPRWNDQREAFLSRDELEQVEERLGVLLQRFWAAMNDEVRPEPRAGKWCSHCPLKMTGCPIPAEQRGTGAITSGEMASAEADRWVVVRELDKQQRATLKTWHEETGRPIPLADGRELRWGQKPSAKSRSFDAWEPEPAS